MNNNETFNRICWLFETAEVDFKVLEHFACRTSEESAIARSTAGVPDAIGAKAILCRMEFSGREVEDNVLVLPGPTRLNSRALKLSLPRLRRFRFATPAEMKALCDLAPGAMPPFAHSVFPQLRNLYVDTSLLNYRIIGFNAGCHERSVVVCTQDYIRAASPTAILDFATV